METSSRTRGDELTINKKSYNRLRSNTDSGKIDQVDIDNLIDEIKVQRQPLKIVTG